METVTISFDEYVTLLRADLYLTALEINGVDNWDWYDEATENFYNMIDTHPILSHVDEENA